MAILPSVTSDEVKAARLRLGLTQADLATRLGVGRVTLNRWEAGIQPVNPTAAILIRLLAKQARTTRRKGR